MAAKALWTSVLVVGLLAVGGFGFAAFTASYQVNLQGTAGNLSIALVDYNTVSSQSYVGCWASSSGANWINFSAGPLAPGDWCELFANVTNTGNVPATLTTTSTVSGACFEGAVLSPSSAPVTVAPGGTVAFQGAIGLLSTAGNSCENTVGGLSVTFSATAGNGGSIPT
jgi:hypothetical protein